MISTPARSSLPLSELRAADVNLYVQRTMCSCVVEMRTQPPRSLQLTPVHPTVFFFGTIGLLWIQFHIQRISSISTTEFGKTSTTKENKRHFICQFNGAIFAQRLFLRFVYHVPQCQQMSFFSFSFLPHVEKS